MEEGDRTMELLLDGYCRNTELLSSEEKLKQWLIGTAEAGEMHVHGEPEVKDYPFPGREGVALSGVLWLRESSITIHTYPEFSFVFINVFHCHEFTAKKVLDWIKQSFGIDKPQIFLFERGIDRNGRPVTTRPYKLSGVA